MSPAETLYHRIAAELPDAVESKMFGAKCLKTPNGKALAMFWKDCMVFKLTGDAAADALSLDGAQVFTPMDNRPMNGWILVPFDYAERWKGMAEMLVQPSMKSATLILALTSFCWASSAITKPCISFNNEPLEQQILEVINHPETKFFYTTKKIPRKMLAKAKEVSKQGGHEYDGVYRMANPNQKFRHGCIIEGSLLTRRLIFVARLKNRHVLCYERGGRSHNLLISFSEINGKYVSYYNLSLEDITPCTEYTNLKQIKLALKEERFSILYNNGGETRLPYVPF